MDEAKRLAEEHGEYIKKLLLRELDTKIELYKEAIYHGFKHGVEYTPSKK